MNFVYNDQLSKCVCSYIARLAVDPHGGTSSVSALAESSSWRDCATSAWTSALKDRFETQFRLLASAFAFNDIALLAAEPT